MKLVYIIRSDKCPICGGTRIRRSKRKGIAEQLARRVTPVRPFRCSDCYNRIYAFRPNAKESA
jgi:Uri superfamily endonuclease